MNITYVNSDGSPTMCDRHPDRLAVHTECWNPAANATATTALPFAGGLAGGTIMSTLVPWVTHAYCDECAPKVEVTMKVRKPK